MNIYEHINTQKSLSSKRWVACSLLQAGDTQNIPSLLGE